MVKAMADRPIIFALANPDPEILPEDVKAVRPDAIMATGRSDYPNQVNNVLCFPYIFRGALDVGATAINEEMKIACATALADLAKAEPSDIVAAAYGGEALKFGPEYLIPKPFDPRLMVEVAPAVAKAAMDSGVATRPIDDFTAYRQRLKRVRVPHGIAHEAGLRQRQAAIRGGLSMPRASRDGSCGQPRLSSTRASPNPSSSAGARSSRLVSPNWRLRIEPDVHFKIVDPNHNRRYEEHWREYHRVMERRGITPEAAQRLMRTRTTALAALMLRLGETDAVLCGPLGDYRMHLRHVLDVIGRRDGVQDVSAMRALIHVSGDVFRVRYPCHSRPDGRRNRRDGHSRRRSHQAVRHRAESGAAVPLQLR